MAKVAKIFINLIPPPIRRFLRNKYRALVFRRALSKLARDPQRALQVQSKVIPDLIRGWGNEEYSAGEEFLRACLKYALRTQGPILECGSGLTTIVLGMITKDSGKTIWSLEDNHKWGEIVNRYIRNNNINSVHLFIKSLKAYRDFSWYDPPSEMMPDDFSLVVCDGPPGKTAGGRYGFVPVMGTHLKSGTVILLDDADRKPEQDIAARWANELKTSLEIFGQDRPYIRLVVK